MPDIMFKDLHFVVTFARTCAPSQFEHLIHSLCPSILGHEMVKAGIILALMGGSPAPGTSAGAKGAHTLCLVKFAAVPAFDLDKQAAEVSHTHTSAAIGPPPQATCQSPISEDGRFRTFRQSAEETRGFSQPCSITTTTIHN